MGTLIVELHAHAASDSSSATGKSSSSGGSPSAAARGPALLRGALKQELDIEVLLLRCNDLAKAVVVDFMNWRRRLNSLSSLVSLIFLYHVYLVYRSERVIILPCYVFFRNIYVLLRFRTLSGNRIRLWSVSGVER